MTHAELVMATARAQDHAQWMVWCEPVLGAHSRVEDGSSGEARPDVLMIRKSWARYEVRIIEVKVTQSDLEQDVKKLKFEKYFPWCDRMSFMCGPGVKHESLIPHPVGIQRWSAKGAQTRRAPPLLKGRSAKMTQDFSMFHALNMNGGRFRHDSRDERIRSALTELENLEVIGKTTDLWKIRTGHLKSLVTAAQTAMRPAEEVEAVTRRETRDKYREDLKALMQINGWGSVGDIAAAIKTLVRSEVGNAEQNIMRGLRGMVQAVDGEGYE